MKKGAIVAILAIFFICISVVAVGGVAYWYFFLRMSKEEAINGMSERYAEIKNFQYTSDISQTTDVTAKVGTNSSSAIAKVTEESDVSVDLQNKRAKMDVKYNGNMSKEGEKENVDSDSVVYIDGSDFYIKGNKATKYTENKLPEDIYMVWEEEDLKKFFENQESLWKNVSRYSDKSEYVGVEDLNGEKVYKYKIDDEETVKKLVPYIENLTKNETGSANTNFKYKTIELILFINKKTGYPAGYELNLVIDMDAIWEGAEITGTMTLNSKVVISKVNGNVTVEFPADMKE